MPQAHAARPGAYPQVQLKSPAQLFGSANTGTASAPVNLQPAHQPAQSFSRVSQWLQAPARPAPVQVTTSVGRVSQILRSPDQLLLRQPSTQASARPVLRGLLGNTAMSSPQRSQIQRVLVSSAQREWQSGVRETGRNRGPRIDAYARNAKFGPGHEWCGFFTAFNYSQAGFKYPESFASYQKARDFFLYRSYTSRSAQTHQNLDQLRQSHRAQGDGRQYMIMEGSAAIDYVNNYKRYYSHINLAEMTYSWQNIPIQPGDVALFSRGHVGQVDSYNPQTGILVTIEGNTSGEGPDGKRWSQAVVRKSYDLSKPEVRARFDGFGRAALADFER